MSELEEIFSRQIIGQGMPEPERELIFMPDADKENYRLWRFDFAWPEILLAVEVNGAVYARGRHARGAGLENDYRKLGEAACLGWTVYQCSGKMVKSGEAIKMVSKLMDYLRSD